MTRAQRRQAPLHHLPLGDLWKEALSLCDDLAAWGTVLDTPQRRRKQELRLVGAVRLLAEAGSQLSL
jgi:hypothetical protein